MIDHLPKLQINLIQEIDRRMKMDPEERSRLSLYWLVNNFSTIIANQEHLEKNLHENTIRELQKLSKERLEYYSSSRFGFIIELFLPYGIY